LEPAPVHPRCRHRDRRGYRICGEGVWPVSGSTSGRSLERLLAEPATRKGRARALMALVRGPSPCLPLRQAELYPICLRYFNRTEDTSEGVSQSSNILRTGFPLHLIEQPRLPPTAVNSQAPDRRFSFRHYRADLPCVAYLVPAPISSSVTKKALPTLAGRAFNESTVRPSS
jgi:hypothetical protein